MTDQVVSKGDGYVVKKDHKTQKIEFRFTDKKGGKCVMNDMPTDLMNACTSAKVQILDLSHTGIHRLPKPLAQHHHIEELYMDGNGLRDVPRVVFMLITLKVLWLHDNRLEKITEDIYQLVNLEHLDLHHNPNLHELPPQMGNRLKKLRYFECVSTGLPLEKLHGGGHQLRGWQLECHGPKALPTRQTVTEPVIDCLVIYQAKDTKAVTLNAMRIDNSLCGKLERLGHHCCTSASDMEAIHLGLLNCKVAVLCFGDSQFPETLLTEVKKSERPVVAVKLYKGDVNTPIQDQFSEFKTQIDYGKNQECENLIQELNILLGIYPPEIVAQGVAAIKKYQEAVQNGVAKDKRSRMLVVGAERVGKTSLINLLTGNKFNPVETSTHVIDVVHVKATSGLGTWESIDGNTHSDNNRQAALEIAEKYRVDEKPSDDPHHQSFDRDQVYQVDQEHSGEEASYIQDLPSEKQEVKLEVAEVIPEEPEFELEESEVPERTKTILNEILYKGSESLQELPMEISIWDFAGQGMYYTTHKVFLSSASIFIVTFDLTKDMNQLATEWVEDGLSNGQVLDFWLDSIYAHTKSSQLLSVLLVGTHAGQASQTQINEASDYIQSLLDRKNHLKGLLNENFEDMFYQMENSLEFEKNEEAKRLKAYIERKVIPGILETRDMRPLGWLEFEKELKTFHTDQNEEKNLATLDEDIHVFKKLFSPLFCIA